MPERPWTDLPLVALDLEGTGAQDRETEAILEIAVVPLVHGALDMTGAFATLINPSRPVPRGAWISPGLTDAVLRHAPMPSTVGPELAERIDGRWIVGHNVDVDWRLLHRRFPAIRPSGLLDTMRLAGGGGRASRSLTALVERHGLTEEIARLVPDGQPHRALWDSVACGLLLGVLIADRWGCCTSSGEVRALAERPLNSSASSGGFEQQTLL
uniref:3'-5' exonuclease n=1 Tax=Herbidospora sakaeratensis TaxID=564415 RepID=UPI0009FE4599|nr:3'-5' exonuclease [Herbidospora sakaeratensis]